MTFTNFTLILETIMNSQNLVLSTLIAFTSIPRVSFLHRATWVSAYVALFPSSDATEMNCVGFCIITRIAGEVYRAVNLSPENI